MRAHDVKHLVICKGCHVLGDSRSMIPTDMEWFHGCCYITEFGEDRFLKLPASHTASITLGDIGPQMMRKLLDALKPAELFPDYVVPKSFVPAKQAKRRSSTAQRNSEGT